MSQREKGDVTLLEELSEENREARDMDWINEENGPDDGPICVIEESFADAVRACSWTRYDEKTKASDDTDEDKVDDHGSCDPDEIVDPGAQAIDA